MNPTFSTSLILLVTLFAFLGGLVNATLLWLNQKPRPPFDGGSFIASALTSIALAVGIAEVFNYSGVTSTVLACFAAFLSGMGTNTAVGGIAGAIIKKPIAGVGAGNVMQSPRSRFIWGAFYRRI